MRRILIVLAAWVCLSGAAHAQQSNEDRLREALKRQTAELRAVQDAQAGLQAQIDDLTKQREALQQALVLAKSQPAAPAPAPAPAPVDDAALAKLQASLDAARKDNAELQAALAKWQAAYKDAASLAQTKDAEAKRLDAALKTSAQTLDGCKQINAKLIATARDTLHLYETQSFRALLVDSYEPLLGLKRVELDNLVQDYDDRILAGKFTGAPRPAAAKAAPP